jgi:glyoxylase-like metal-dependent hydrolase (beta-lactamase superfamily II)
MAIASAQAPLVNARALARRIVGSDVPVVVVDIRDHADFTAWRIDAPGVGVDVRNFPLDTVMRRLDGLVAELPAGAEVVVASYLGDSAGTVAGELVARGVNAAVLEGGMTGWARLLRPVRVRLAVPGLKVIQVQRVSRGCLSYVVIGDGEALVVDPGADVSGYAALAARYGAEIRAVMDTHLHGDHISGARALARACGAELLLPEPTLRRGIAFADEVSAVSDGDAVPLAGVSARAISLPGHTRDMTGLVLGTGALIAGDSLRAAAIAHPEATGAEAAELALELHRTLHERIFTLGPRVRLLPAHYAGGVRRGPVSPAIAEARAAVPEVELPAKAFARRAPALSGEEHLRATRIAEANAGREEASTDLESAAVAPR